MTARVCLLDTGPLVSLLASGLTHHEWAVEQWKRLRPPLLTCEPVPKAANVTRVSEVLTLDSDFRVYRRHGNKTIPIRTPE